jgi:Na+/proline symporter
VVTHDIPIALGRTVGNELYWGRVSTLVIAIISAIVAQFSGTMVAFLGVFGWGLFGSTLVPALAFGLNWEGATRQGAIASMITGLLVTLVFETLAFFRLYSFPAGIAISGLSLVLSILMFFAASWLTRKSAPGQLDADVRIVMES